MSWFFLTSAIAVGVTVGVTIGQVLGERICDALAPAPWRGSLVRQHIERKVAKRERQNG